MREEALKEETSWPNVDFFEQHGAYAQNYGWGKQLIMDYLATQPQYPSLLDAYVAFVKRPVLPSNMVKIIAASKTK